MLATTAPLAVLPIKPVTAAKRRLASYVAPGLLEELVTETASRVVEACRIAGTDPLVIAGDAGVAAWAHRLGIRSIPDPGGGLNGAAAAGAAAAVIEGRPWMIVHADLPLLTPQDVATVAAPLVPGTAVLAPSRDGGTNVIAATTSLQFQYGTGSFGRHLAAAAHLDRHVVIRVGTLVELDTPDDLFGASRLPGGRWLRRYLG